MPGDRHIVRRVGKDEPRFPSGHHPRQAGWLKRAATEHFVHA
jgi:hypothetical protein